MRRFAEQNLSVHGAGGPWGDSHAVLSRFRLTAADVPQPLGVQVLT